jgi:hypothetical protein
VFDLQSLTLASQTMDAAARAAAAVELSQVAGSDYYHSYFLAM